MKIEVLVSTMNQRDFSLLEKMNIKSDALFINQTDTHAYEEARCSAGTARMYSFTNRGLSASRNEALLHAAGDICLLADDDIMYSDTYVQEVTRAFEQLPTADVIVFNIKEIHAEKMVKRKAVQKIRKAPRNRYYCSVRIAFRRESVLAGNIWFPLHFGSGSVFSSGEESIFLRNARKAGLKIYEHPAYISTVDYTNSTWFSGYDKKFFYDKGAFLQAAYPKSKHFFKFYYLLRFYRVKEMTAAGCLKYINLGIKGAKTGKGYDTD